MLAKDLNINIDCFSCVFLLDNIYFSESFRCGVFFAGKGYKDKPFEKLFIIPKRFPINQTYYNGPDNEDAPKRYSNHGACPIAEPYGTAENPSVHNDTCYNIVRVVFNIIIKNLIFIIRN